MAVNETEIGTAIKTEIDAYIATLPDPKGDNLNRNSLMIAFAKGILDGNTNWQADYSQTDTTKTDFIKNKPSVGTQVQSDYMQTDTGAVDYIKNKPSIIEPVQSDYTEGDSGDLAFIKNKPTIVTPVQSDWDVIDTGSLAHILNKPTIPAAQIQGDYTQADTGAVDYIKNKPTALISHIEANITSDQTCTASGWYDVVWNELVDNNSEFANNTFTVKVAGVFQINYSFYLWGATSSPTTIMEGRINIDGTSYALSGFIESSTRRGLCQGSIAITLPVDATIKIQYYTTNSSSQKIVASNGGGYFSVTQIR